MVKALSFKGDAKPKKRKRTEPSESKSLSTTTTALQPQSNETAADDDDTTWVTADSATDISGPVLFVLPTTPPTALASDANGSIFASLIENMVEDSPATAEPHDVRQVWIANRVAGSAAFSFKGAHGRYLAADRFGVLSAVREAVGPEEGFVCDESLGQDGEGENEGETKEVSIRNSGPTFSLKTGRGTYVSAAVSEKGVKREGGTDPSPRNQVQIELRADSNSSSASSSRVIVRMQARFKPRLATAKVEKAREKISRSQIEVDAGRKLEDDEVRRLKKARRDGTYHEALLDIKVKGKHDKFA